jgi:rhodanese-related sulfurtransferase
MPETGAPAPGVAVPEVEQVTPTELRAMLKANYVEVLDFATSLEFRAWHVPGAAFAIRARLAAHLERWTNASLIICTSPDGMFARFAASDLSAMVSAPVKVLEGGTKAWRAAGFALETGAKPMLEPAEDVYYKPYDHTGQVEQAMQDYLDWEVALVEKIARDPDCRFVDFPLGSQEARVP